MQATSVTKSGGTGVTQWVPVNQFQANAGISLANTIQSGSTLTYKNQHTFDNPNDTIPFNVSRVTTVATALIPNHGLVVGDSVDVEGCGAPFDGNYDVASVVDANNITYTVSDSGPTAASGRISTMRVFDHSGITGKTANQDGNYSFPVAAIRLNVTAWTAGGVTLTVRQGTQ